LNLLQPFGTGARLLIIQSQAIFKPSRLPFPAALWLAELQEVPAIHPIII